MEIKKTELFFKVLLHILILFILLLSLFWLLISKVQANLLTNSVESSLTNLIKDFKNSYSTAKPSIQFKQYADLDFGEAGRSAVEEALEKELSKEDELMSNNNSHVKNLGYVYVILFIIIVLTFLGTLYGVNDASAKKFPVWFIIKENIIIFIFIGIIEAMFFYYIAMKYSPVLPSDVNTMVKNKLINKLGEEK